MSPGNPNDLSELTIAERKRAEVIEPGYTFSTVTDKISSIVLGRKTPIGWFLALGVSFSLLMVLLYSVGLLFVKGVGVWGVNVPVGWGFAIINFVWWIGIGHAGTLISAILLLLRHTWRTSINRFAEAMTLFAVSCAGLYPILHLGRPWLAYWLFPYPNTMKLWPQFRSPLIWDVFAVSTYATVSALFWYVGLIPDFATLRDRSTARAARFIYGLLAMGWRGSSLHWRPKPHRCCSRASPRRSSSPSTRSSASISRSPSCPGGTPPSSPPTSSRERFIPASRW